MLEQNEPKLEFSLIYDELKKIISSIKTVSYTFMDDEVFEKLEKLSESQYIYWIEIIQRTHFCAFTSLQRVFKWMNSMNDSWNTNNYYGFCTSIRGLIEACSDSFYTISKIIYPITENHFLIEKALNGKAETLTLSEDIENELIHYMFGRKLSSEEKRENPQSHKALQVTDYLNHIGDEKVKRLYSELCQVSHPSMMSFAPFSYNDPEFGQVIHNQDIDSILNNQVLKEYKESIILAINFAIVPSIALLNLISITDAKSINSLKIHANLLKYVNQSEYWKELEQIVQKSKEN